MDTVIFDRRICYSLLFQLGQMTLVCLLQPVWLSIEMILKVDEHRLDFKILITYNLKKEHWDEVDNN